MQSREFSIIKEIRQHRFHKDFPGYNLYLVRPSNGMSSIRLPEQYLLTREELTPMTTTMIDENHELSVNMAVGKKYSGDLIYIYQPLSSLSSIFRIVDVLVADRTAPKMKFKNADIDRRTHKLYVAERDCGDYPKTLAKIFSTQAFQLQDTIPVAEIDALRPRHVSEPVEYYLHDETAYLDRLWRAHKAGM